MTTPTYTEFADTPCPWMADQPFWEQNAAGVQDVMTLVAEDYPHTAATVEFDPTVMPPDEQRAALWKLLMGRQHGDQEQSDGKVDISAERTPVYLEALGRIAVGPHPIMDVIAVDSDIEYDQALLNCGTPEENLARLETADKPNVHSIVALTGQRKRGMWDHITSERTPQDLFTAIGERTGTDMEALAARSPFIQNELLRTGGNEDWDGPLATEYHMFRLAVEAKFADLIDWDNYQETVQTQAPIGLNDQIDYLDEGRDTVVTVPPREEGAVTYELKDGRKVHVINGAAAARPHGAPRATSTSIAGEAMSYVPLPSNANVLAVTAVPHFRAAMDTVVTYLDQAPNLIARADVAASQLGVYTHIVAALGELMATMKADHRLREVLRGGNPNKPELASI